MTPKEFFTQEQVEKIGKMRVGSGMIIMKTDEGLVSVDLVYIDRETGTVNDWETGKPLVVELHKFDRQHASP